MSPLRNPFNLLCCLPAAVFLLAGCRPVVEWTDRDVDAVIAERQREALSYQAPVDVPVADELFSDPPRGAYAKNPNPRSTEVPAGFSEHQAPARDLRSEPEASARDLRSEPEASARDLRSEPEASARDLRSEPEASARDLRSEPEAPARDELAEAVTTQPAVDVFTLTDALAYAQRHRRALQTAKENLYLVALSLTLERHLWTPVFASNLRTVYGNFGEIRDFDQAMRFVANLSVSQRLPYGGEFTAQAVSTLIRDVKKTITASEGSTIELGLSVPFLRNAGDVAQEDLIQLERELTYAVRSFERFRRRQLVEVAAGYFDLLRTKQSVIDRETSLERFILDYERAQAFEDTGTGTPLDTLRAEQLKLSAENDVEDGRERFRAQADRFKIMIGMPVDQALGRHDLEDIELIEGQIAEGKYPLLLRPPAVGQQERALQVAVENRLDLLSERDRIDDARRGVAIAKNGLLPDLDWNSNVTWDTDPSRYKLGDFSFERTTWRSELVLGLPLERTRERNRYRASLIDVRRAQRNYQDSLESIRAEVRSAANQIGLQERSVEIQRQNLAVAERRREYARIQYEDGDIGNRDLFEAEDEWTRARNRLNQAKTSLWTALLNFRLATETLRIDESGVQQPDAEGRSP